MPTVPKEKAIRKLRTLAEAGGKVSMTGLGDPHFKKWFADSVAALRNIFGEKSAQLGSFTHIQFTPMVASMYGDNSAAYHRSFCNGLTSALKQLEAYADEIADFWPDEDRNQVGEEGANMGGYDIAQVCLNGHVANESTRLSPEFNKDYCDRCGEKTITACLKCQMPIHGGFHLPGVIAISEYEPPGFCHKCGAPFPWTERSIEAAIDLAVESGNLDAQEQEQFKASVNEITRDTPKAQVAGSRMGRLLAKMGKGTADAIRDVLVDVVSEAAKKTIWPGK